MHETPSSSGVHPLSEPHRGQSVQEKTIHVIVDNYATHKHPEVMGWLEKHRRFVFHFTPTSASWLNAIEGFFAKLTKKRLKRGVFRSLQELKDAIHRFLDHTNANPKPFTWTKDPNKIIAAVKRGHQVLDSIHEQIPPSSQLAHIRSVLLQILLRKEAILPVPSFV